MSETKGFSPLDFVLRPPPRSYVPWIPRYVHYECFIRLQPAQWNDGFWAILETALRTVNIMCSVIMKSPHHLSCETNDIYIGYVLFHGRYTLSVKGLHHGGSRVVNYCMVNCRLICWMKITVFILWCAWLLEYAFDSHLKL